MRSEHKGRPQPMHVALITDGRPGHVRQADACVMAISRRHGQPEITTFEIAPASRLSVAMLRPLAHRLPPRAVLKATLTPASFARLRDFAQPDLVLSVGGNTLAANIALARLSRAPNLYIGTVRNAPAHAIAMTLAPYDSHGHKPNHVVADKPAPIDPDRLPVPRAWAVARADRPRLGLLIGGPAGTHPYADDDWDRVLALIVDLRGAWGADWVLSTAPRTPGPVADRLAALAATGAIAQFIDFRSAGPGSLGPVLGADAILVTDDSASMIFEAAATRRPVVSLRPAMVTPGRDEEAYQRLISQGRLSRLDLAHLTPSALDAAIAAQTPLTTHPLDALYALIAPLISPRLPAA